MTAAGIKARDMVAAVALAVFLAIVLHPVYEREQAQRRAIEAEWVREQRAAERAYCAEVEAERARWAAIEEAERDASRHEVEAQPEPYNDPDIPDDIEEAARKYGAAYGIAPEFLEAIAWRESRYDPEAVNGGCVGLMQVSPRWHAERMERLGVEDLTDVNGCMAVAADYLRELFDIYDDPCWVLMTYNGDSNADAYLAGTASASEYAEAIVRRAASLTITHEEGGSEK